MTLFDFIAVIILLVSGVVGFARGATREVMTVLAFVLAVVIAVFSLHYTGPIARRAIHQGFLANAVAILVVFAVAYILLRIAGAGLTRSIHQAEALGTLDRVVGVGFGLLRGLILLGVFYLVFHAATPPERVPHWIKDAALYPLAGFAGHALMGLEPEGSAVANKVGPALERAVRDGSSQPGDSSAPAGKGYDERSRETVDALVEKSR